MIPQPIKSIFYSKTFWLAAVQMAIGIIAVVIAQYPAIADVGYVVIGKSILDMILRAITTGPVSVPGIPPKND